MVCFNLISATEAYLRLDFYARVYDRDKSSVGRKFRDIHKDVKNKVSLEDHIIEIWKAEFIDQKVYFSDFAGLLNYRHWLAHGRYWTPKLGRYYDAHLTYGIVEKIFDIAR